MEPGERKISENYSRICMRMIFMKTKPLENQWDKYMSIHLHVNHFRPRKWILGRRPRWLGSKVGPGAAGRLHVAMLCLLGTQKINKWKFKTPVDLMNLMKSMVKIRSLSLWISFYHPKWCKTCVLYTKPLPALAVPQTQPVSPSGLSCTCVHVCPSCSPIRAT